MECNVVPADFESLKMKRVLKNKSIFNVHKTVKRTMENKLF